MACFYTKAAGGIYRRRFLFSILELFLINRIAVDDNGLDILDIDKDVFALHRRSDYRGISEMDRRMIDAVFIRAMLSALVGKQIIHRAVGKGNLAGIFFCLSIRLFSIYKLLRIDCVKNFVAVPAAFPFI